MDKLSDIAKDYLVDFEVLTEARKEFESQLDDWWRVLLRKYVKPALTEANQGEFNIWENQNRPNMCHCRASANQEVLLQLTDPRASDRGYYTVSLNVVPQTALKKLSKQEALVKRLDELADKLKVGDQAGLKWTNTELARKDIMIIPDDPEETMQQVCAAVVSFFWLVIEHYHATNEETKT